MMSSIIREYIRAFRWQNVKDQFKYGVGNFSLYILIMFPINTFIIFSEKWRGLALFLLDVPVALALFTTMLQPMGLSKMMYLCPMSEDMRKDYIRKAAYIRMIASILLGLPGIIWLFVAGSFGWLYIIGIVLNITLPSVVLGRGSNAFGYAQKKRTEDTKMGLDDIFGLRQMALIGMTMLMNIVYATSEGKGDPWWIQLILLGLVLLISLPISISCMKEWPDAVEQAATYEGSGGIWREQESK